MKAPAAHKRAGAVRTWGGGHPEEVTINHTSQSAVRRLRRALRSQPQRPPLSGLTREDPGRRPGFYGAAEEGVRPSAARAGLVRRRSVLRGDAGLLEPGRAAAALARPAGTERRDEPRTEVTAFIPPHVSLPFVRCCRFTPSPPLPQPEIVTPPRLAPPARGNSSPTSSN